MFAFLTTQITSDLTNIYRNPKISPNNFDLNFASTSFMRNCMKKP